MTDTDAKESYDITHLHELPYLGDDRMSEFLVAWHRVLNDQDGDVSAKQRRQIFHKQIKDSEALKG